MSAPAVLPAVHPALTLLHALATGVPVKLADGAACGSDPELHTGPDTDDPESPDQRAAREQVAKEVCAECPVRSLCLDRALQLRPACGVWAGMTAEEISGLAHIFDTFGLTDHGSEVACWWCQGEGCRSCGDAGWVALLIDESPAREES